MSEKIKSLTDYSHARLRTEMYLGSRELHTQNILTLENNELVIKENIWVPAVFTAFREVIDNSLDEVCAHGFGDTIKVNYDEKTGVMSVEDNGRGIPIDFDETLQKHSATIALSHARAGRNFETRGNVAGVNGVGASIVNFCSQYFNLDVYRDNKHFSQRFLENDEDSNNIKETTPIIKNIKGKTGTKVEFSLSSKVFKYTTLPESFVKTRIYEIAVSNPQIKVYYNNSLIKIKPKQEENLFKDKNVVKIHLFDDDADIKYYIVGGDTGIEYYHSLVNNIPAFDGGVQIETFKKVFYTELAKHLEKEAKKLKITVSKSDICDSIIVYNIIKMNAPSFDSQSKTRLINESIGKLIKSNLEDEKIYKDIIRKNPEWIKQILERALNRQTQKDQAEIDKKSKKLLKAKVSKLMDANSKDRSKCVCFFTEGDSAVASLSSVRDPEIHGGLPLRGKVLNVNGEPVKKVLDNAVLKDVMNTLGLNPTQKAIRSNLRYGNVYLASDMDADGANINSLLINFFYTYWPELFKDESNPFIYIFMTPFVIAEKDKQRKYWYSHNYHEFKGDDWKGWGITRAKGLGTLTKEDWQYSIHNPVLVPVIDDGRMLESLSLIFDGTKANERKEWIGI